MSTEVVLDINLTRTLINPPHSQELLGLPSIEDIVHFDQWARDWTAAKAKKSFGSSKAKTLTPV